MLSSMFLKVHLNFSVTKSSFFCFPTVRLSAGPYAACPAARWRRSSPTFTLTAARCATSAPNAPSSSPMSFPPAAAAWTSSTTLPRGKPDLLLLALLLLRVHSCSFIPNTRFALNQTLSAPFHLTHGQMATPSPSPSSSINSRGFVRRLHRLRRSSATRPSTV